ncbi:hypothetical protein DFH07DRAFT_782593 [Mycena maculata]|uniref:Uncharacterized protein n=1 Tax=Mycena maculata TaxID=230809 RepID=A0AAD7HS27_9AGAR|nr:hypothetical protein DFH07DRAFT_782593 [Mycena maculata]
MKPLRNVPHHREEAEGRWKWRQEKGWKKTKWEEGQRAREVLGHERARIRWVERGKEEGTTERGRKARKEQARQCRVGKEGGKTETRQGADGKRGNGEKVRPSENTEEGGKRETEAGEETERNNGRRPSRRNGKVERSITHETGVGAGTGNGRMRGGAQDEGRGREAKVETEERGREANGKEQEVAKREVGEHSEEQNWGDGRLPKHAKVRRDPAPCERLVAERAARAGTARASTTHPTASASSHLNCTPCPRRRWRHGRRSAPRRVQGEAAQRKRAVEVCPARLEPGGTQRRSDAW